MLYSVWHARAKTDERGRRVGIRGEFGFRPTTWPEDFQHVADVRCTEIGAVFQLTNHIFAPWYENDEVRVPPGVRRETLRSTSVGDIIAVGEDLYCVAPVGLRKVNAPTIPSMYETVIDPSWIPS